MNFLLFFILILILLSEAGCKTGDNNFDMDNIYMDNRQVITFPQH